MAKNTGKRERHGLSGTPLYGVYISMFTRCYTQSDKRYEDYGGRGIKVCDEWKDITAFFNWAENNGYRKGLQIDRINNDGNYEPSNCQWITGMKNHEAGKQRQKKNNTSGYNGVSFNSDRSKWASRIDYRGKVTQMGYFNTKEEAIQARIDKEIEIFGEQRTNLHYVKNGV